MYSPRQVLARSVRVSVSAPRLAPPTDLDVERACLALGCSLPPAFVEFQRLLGGRAIVGLDVLRLAASADDETSLVEKNLAWRSPRHGIGLPATLIAFAPDGSGNLFCFDMRDPVGEPPIVLWDPLLDRRDNLADLAPLHHTFIDWLEAELDLVAAA